MSGSPGLVSAVESVHILHTVVWEHIFLMPESICSTSLMC